MEEMILSIALSVIKTVVKNPKKRAHMKEILLKVRNAISVAYPED